MIPFVKLANDLYSSAYFPAAQLRATRAKMQEASTSTGKTRTSNYLHNQLDAASGSLICNQR
jgi:hypothetical protein